MGISPEEFAKRFGSGSRRAGGASTTLNAGVPEAVIRKHGDWKSSALFRYIEYSPEVESTPARAIASYPKKRKLSDSATPTHRSFLFGNSDTVTYPQGTYNVNV